MTIRLSCPHCGKAILAPDKAAGSKARCLACDGILRIPAAGEQAAFNNQDIDFEIPESAEPQAALQQEERVRVACASCGKAFAVAARHAGKSVKCPNCQIPIKVPGASSKPAVAGAQRSTGNEAIDFDAALQGTTAHTAADPNDPFAEFDQMSFEAGAPAALPPVVQGVKKKKKRPKPEEETFDPEPDSVGDWTRIFLYAYMGMAMIPLAVTLFLPEAALGEAHLPEDSKLHWVYAAISAAGFLTLLLISIRSPDAGPLMLVLVGAFTGTIGILLLLILQAIAFWANGFMIRGRGLIVAIMLLIKFIGLMYYYALHPDSGFWASFYGFTLGVGLCEEVCKLIPVIWYLQNNRNVTWKGACLVGLASGIGFGVSEGIFYGGMYNGSESWEIYVVRFVSCVALHAAWSATIACTMYRRSDLGGSDDFWDLVIAIVIWIGIPVVLHGMYDTLLKHELHIWALATAVLTIGWMALSVERAARSTA